jgi:hypothetical protein
MGETVKRLPHIAWTYAAHAWTIFVRLWALPFVVVGWVCGVIAMAFGMGCAEAIEPSLGKWAASLRRAHEPKPINVDEDDFDSFDED